MRRWFAFFLAIELLPVAGCAQPTAAAPPASAAARPLDLRTVHFDTIDPAKVTEFEAARRDWLAALRARGSTDARGWFMQAGNVFFTMHRFGSWSDLDRLRAERRAAVERMPKTDVDRYDSRSDTSLTPPHYSEVWLHDPEDDYVSPAVAADDERAGAMRIQTVQLAPGPESARYDEGWADARRELASAHFPLSCVVFTTLYGSGRIVFLWLARSESELHAAPAIEDVLVTPRGKAALERMKSVVVDEKTLTAVRRADLDSP